MVDEQDYYGERRVIIVKLEYNRKQLDKAIEDGKIDKMNKLERNIKLYENELRKLENSR